MSLLQQNPNTLDDAAGGEEFTKGSSPIVIPAVVAAVLVTVAIAIYMFAGQKPPVATGEVTRVAVHRMHHETKDVDASGAAMPKDAFDQILVFTHLKVHNQSKAPITVHNIMANVTLPDGIHSSTAASPFDYERLFQFSPQLASLHGSSLPIETTIEPGKSLEGDFVASFRMSQADWDSRKGLDFSVSIPYQATLKLTPTSPITVQ